MTWLRYSLHVLRVCDGDKLLVVSDPELIKIAKRNVEKYDIVPLYYNMAKAEAKILNSDELYHGLILAYTGGNIGEISNAITKIWNSGEITEEKINAVKWLCMENNFTIDYAKTLYKPTRPEWVNKIITKYTKNKVPNFFQYAKGKDKSQVENTGINTVDRIKELIPQQKLSFNFKNDNVGKFDYKLLMKNPNIEVDDEVIERFKTVSSNLKFNSTDGIALNYQVVYETARNEIMSDKYTIDDIVDMLVEDLFHRRRTEKKKAFWEMFDDVVYNHLVENVPNGFVQCEHCQKRFRQETPGQKYCKSCLRRELGKKKTKTVACEDCGKLIEVSTKHNHHIRCEECAKRREKICNAMEYRRRKARKINLRPIN